MSNRQPRRNPSAPLLHRHGNSNHLRIRPQHPPTTATTQDRNILHDQTPQPPSTKPHSRPATSKIRDALRVQKYVSLPSKIRALPFRRQLDNSSAYCRMWTRRLGLVLLQLILGCRLRDGDGNGSSLAAKFAPLALFLAVVGERTRPRPARLGHCGTTAWGIAHLPLAMRTTFLHDPSGVTTELRTLGSDPPLGVVRLATSVPIHFQTKNRAPSAR